MTSARSVRAHRRVSSMATPLVSEVFESDAPPPVRGRGFKNLTDTNNPRYIGTAAGRGSGRWGSTGKAAIRCRRSDQPTSRPCPGAPGRSVDDPLRRAAAGADRSRLAGGATQACGRAVRTRSGARAGCRGDTAQIALLSSSLRYRHCTRRARGRPGRPDSDSDRHLRVDRTAEGHSAAQVGAGRIGRSHPGQARPGWVLAARTPGAAHRRSAGPVALVGHRFRAAHHGHRPAIHCRALHRSGRPAADPGPVRLAGPYAAAPGASGRSGHRRVGHVRQRAGRRLGHPGAVAAGSHAGPASAS